MFRGNRRYAADNVPLRDKLQVLIPNIRWALKLSWDVAPLWLSVLVAFTILLGGIPAVQALIARQLINAVVDSIGSGGQFFAAVAPWLVAGLVATIAQELLQTGKRYAGGRFNDHLQLKVTVRALEHAATLDVAMFENPAYQDVIERAQQNIATKVYQFVSNLFTWATSAIQLVSVLGILIAIDPIATVVLLPIAAPYMIFSWRQAREGYYRRRNRATKRRWTNYFSSLLLSRQSIPEVKFLALAPLLIERYRSFMQEFITEDRKLSTRILIGEGVFASAFALLFYGASAWIAWRVVQGTLTVGDLTIYIRAAIQLQHTIEGTSSSFTSMMEQILYVADLTEFLSLQPELTSDKGLRPESLRGDIVFEGVAFTYPGSEPEVLSDINLQIGAGEVVALVGENGAGKTTLVSLLARLYDPTRGRILVDGIDIRDLAADHLYSQIAFVLQSFNRYEATTADNIAYGDWKRLLGDREQVERIGQRAGLDDLIAKMPEGYDTMLGRRFGAYDLSGGEWQKIALARAFARPASLIVLDEPTSNLDVQAEYELFLRLRDLAQGRTTIIISHRFSTVSMADRIIVLSEGRIIESGPHHDLMALNGYYASLYRLHQAQLEPAGPGSKRSDTQVR